MSVSNEIAVAEEAAVRALRATKANDVASRGPVRHSAQTDECPHVARFATVYRFNGHWTAEEQGHVDRCAFCFRVKQMFVAAAATATVEDTVTNLVSPEEATALNLPAAGAKLPGQNPKQG